MSDISSIMSIADSGICALYAVRVQKYLYTNAYSVSLEILSNVFLSTETRNDSNLLSSVRLLKFSPP